MKKFRNVKWIFFDVGGPILGDDAQLKDYYEQIYRFFYKNGVVSSKDEILKLREKFLKERKHSSIPRQIIRFLSKSEEEYEQNYRKVRETCRGLELAKPQERAHETLSFLSKKAYCLGIIANQTPKIRNVLKKHRLLDFFSKSSAYLKRSD